MSSDTRTVYPEIEIAKVMSRGALLTQVIFASGFGVLCICIVLTFLIVAKHGRDEPHGPPDNIHSEPIRLRQESISPFRTEELPSRPAFVGNEDSIISERLDALEAQLRALSEKLESVVDQISKPAPPKSGPAA